MRSNCFSLVDFSTSENVNNETILLPRQHFPKYDIFRIVVPSKFVDKKCPLSNAVLSTLGWLLFIFQNVDIFRNVQRTCILTQVDSYKQYITQKKGLFKQFAMGTSIPIKLRNKSSQTIYLVFRGNSFFSSIYLCTYLYTNVRNHMSVSHLFSSQSIVQSFCQLSHPWVRKCLDSNFYSQSKILIKQIILC